MVMLLKLSCQRRVHLRYFTRFTGDAIAQNHWCNAVRLKKCGGSGKTRVRGRNHAVFNAREYGVAGL